MHRGTATWLLALLLAGGLSADEPWKTKPSKDWGEREVNQILNNSPWARTISAPATWLRTGQQGPEVGTKITILGKRTENDDLQTPPPVHDKLYNQYARFLLRWESSRTVRVASARKAMLGGQMRPGEPALEPADMAGEFELVLFNAPMAPFSIADEVGLKAETCLLVVGTERKVYPKEVRIRRRDDGQIMEVHFFFPKTNVRGEPVFLGKESAIEFQCYVAGAFLRARFEPRRMRDSQGLDLL